MAAQDKTRTRASDANRDATSRTSRTSRSPVVDEPAAPSSVTTAAATAATPSVEPVAPPSTSPVPPVPAIPPASPRNDVEVSVETVRRAFAVGSASRSVALIQEALIARGANITRRDGVADHDTRVAYARYQESIREAPTGLPTVESLDYLGFTIVG